MRIFVFCLIVFCLTALPLCNPPAIGGRTNWKFFSQVKSENLDQGDKADYFTSKGTVNFLRKENCMYQAKDINLNLNEECILSLFPPTFVLNDPFWTSLHTGELHLDAVKIMQISGSVGDQKGLW